MRLIMRIHTDNDVWIPLAEIARSDSGGGGKGHGMEDDLSRPWPWSGSGVKSAWVLAPRWRFWSSICSGDRWLRKLKNAVLCVLPDDDVMEWLWCIWLGHILDFGLLGNILSAGWFLFTGGSLFAEQGHLHRLFFDFSCVLYRGGTYFLRTENGTMN